MAFLKVNDNDISEHRMDITLSNLAYETLLNDMDAFGAKGKSTIINRIIELCAVNRNDSDISIVGSEVNIDEAVVRRRNKLINDIKTAKEPKRKKSSPSQGSKSGKKGSKGMSGKEPTETEITPKEEETVDYIISIYRDELIKRFVKRSFTKDKTIKIRFQNDIYKHYVSGTDAQFPHYNSARKYIIAILEDYARKSFFMREEIYFYTTYKIICDKVNVPLKKRKLLRITLNNGKVYRMIPYRMSTEGEAPYHYLIGLSMTSDKNKTGTQEYQPKVIRLSRIDNVIELDKVEWEETNLLEGKVEERRLEKAIQEKGVAFLGNPEENVEYTVSLTPNGMRKYNQILHLRPAPIGKKEPDLDRPGNTLLRFKCAEDRIIFYFTRLCEDAIILSPKKTADKMKEQYKKAYEAYNSR